MTEHVWKEKLTDEGYRNVATHTFPPSQDFGSHTHKETTVHIILKGELTLTDDIGPTILVEGDRFNMAAGTNHNAKCGPEGLTMLVGNK